MVILDSYNIEEIDNDEECYLKVLISNNIVNAWFKPLVLRALEIENILEIIKETFKASKNTYKTTTGVYLHDSEHFGVVEIIYFIDGEASSDERLSIDQINLYDSREFESMMVMCN